MSFQNFELEYFQSQFERTVEINLADSSVKCASVRELLASDDPQPLIDLPLYYPEVNGTALLRVCEQNGRLSISEPVATSIAFVRYHFDMPSVDLADHIRQRASVLVAPGTYLGTEHHLRIAVGYEPEKVKMALERIGGAVTSLEVSQLSASRE